MKEMSKVKIYLKKSLSYILSERIILSKLHYSLIANLNFSFQDKEFLYLILDYLPGGDLRYYMTTKMVFNECQIKFMIANLLLSLRYIHSNNILHRDIKPSNLVFDDKGYLHLTDFNISQKIRAGKPILSKSGTPGYISPEVLLNKPQNFCSDFFSVGVICYELLMGKQPFKGKNKKKIAEKILYKNIKLTKKDIPENYNIMIGDFINKLLKRNARERLGTKSIDEIINHPWLEGVEWEIIESKLVDSDSIPFIPSVGDNFDSTSANEKDDMNMDNYDKYLKKVNESGFFKNYYYNYYSFSVITKCKSIYEKTSIGHKYTTATEGVKSSFYQSEVDHGNNDITLENNNNISYNLPCPLNNSEPNKNNKEEESDEYPRKSRTNYIKSNTTLKRRIIGYHKQKMDKIKKNKLFSEKDEDNNFENDCKDYIS